MADHRGNPNGQCDDRSERIAGAKRERPGKENRKHALGNVQQKNECAPPGPEGSAHICRTRIPVPKRPYVLPPNRLSYDYGEVQRSKEVRDSDAQQPVHQFHIYSVRASAPPVNEKAVRTSWRPTQRFDRLPTVAVE